MKNIWFRWEREATIHLLFPTLEAFFKPLKKYTGVSAPTMILLFEKGVVTWCIKEDEFIQYGKKLLQIYSDPSKEKRLVSDIKKSLIVLKQIGQEIEKLDFKSLSDNDLVKVHQKLYVAFLNYYTMGAIGTPLSFAAEVQLKNSGLSDDVINKLTTPKTISYISKAEDYLLKTKDAKGFISKYFWIDNNYSGTKVLTEDDVKEKLNNLKNVIPAKGSHAVGRGIQFEESRIDPRMREDDKANKRLIQLLKNYAMYKDDRKKEILIYLAFMDTLLKEVSLRKKLLIEEVRSSLPYEIEDILNGKINKRELRERLKYCVIVWQKDAEMPLILNGKQGEFWEQKTLEVINTDSLIQGRVACGGKVVGKVRVLLNAKDCDHMKDGEVLVTFMTSPDFMPAIRRASAIITNLGGVTSHAAIISRELNIPCIVGTSNAVQILKTGDLVEVDAYEGTIKKLDEKA